MHPSLPIWASVLIAAAGTAAFAQSSGPAAAPPSLAAKTAAEERQRVKELSLQAQAAWGANDYGEAARLYRELCERQPAGTHRLRLAQALDAAGRANDAVAAYLDWFRENPAGSASYAGTFFAACARAGATNAAAGIAAQQAGQRGDNERVHGELARALGAAGFGELALAHAIKAADRAETDERRAIWQAEAAGLQERAGRKREAAALLRASALGCSSGSASRSERLRRSLELLRETGGLDAYLADVQARAATADTASVLELAEVLSQFKQYEEVPPLFERIAASNRTVRVYERWVSALALIRDFARQAQVYGEFLAAHPDSRSAHLRGWMHALAQAGDLKRALAVGEEYAERTPGGAGWYELAMLCSRLRLADEAERHFDRAVRDATADAERVVRLAEYARFLSAAGRTDRLEPVLQSLKSGPLTDAVVEQVRRMEAMVEAARTRRTQLEALRRRADASPLDAEAQREAGDAHRLNGEFASAVRYYQRLVELDPSAESHADLAAALESAGRFDEAVACYGAAIEQCSDPEVRDYLALQRVEAGDRAGRRRETEEFIRGILARIENAYVREALQRRLGPAGEALR